MTKLGERVGAVLSSKDGVVYFLGYGKYVADVEVEGLASPNPQIRLDDGTYVYGYQCWWGPEDVIKRRFLSNAEEIVNAEVPDDNYGGGAYKWDTN